MIGWRAGLWYLGCFLLGEGFAGWTRGFAFEERAFAALTLAVRHADFSTDAVVATLLVMIAALVIQSE